MKLKLLFYSIILFFSNVVFGQVNVVFIVNNEGDEVQEMLEELTNSKKYKDLNIRILNFCQENSSREELTMNDKRIDRINIKNDCDFDYCEKLTNTIDSDFSNLIFFYAKKNIPCLQQNKKIEESSINSTLSKDFVKGKVDFHLVNYKKNKKSVTLYFNYLTEEIVTEKPEVSFKNDTLWVKEGENVSLTPNFTSKSKEIIWRPTVGLSCSNCENPTLKAKSNASYFVKYLDESGCPSNEVKIDIVVKSNCDSLKRLEIQLTKFKRAYGQDFEYEIMPISKEGGFRYDIPLTRNCAIRFKMTIRDIKGHVVYIVEKDRDEILNNADKLYGENSGLFLFRINLKDHYREIQEGGIIQIESFDENGNNFKTYVSPQVSFSGCSAM
jgi:hypothetical protein